eukprot:symbB.v1.2.006149.t1/scaffold360.1/size220131/3
MRGFIPLFIWSAAALVHNRTREALIQQDLTPDNLTILETKGLSNRQTPPVEQAPAPEISSPKDFVNLIFGFLAFTLAISIHWFNEERSAKIEVLLTKGLEDCRSVDANHLNTENRGRLVHVQGRAVGRVPIADSQFQDASVHDCLKLQSTLEVLQWVPAASGFMKDLPGQPRHVLEWSTSYQDSSRFRQPSPQNPRLPTGLHLGTRTTPCSRVTLGAFSLSEDMLVHFRSFESAATCLPDKVHAADIPFFSCQDGFFYGRPGFRGSEAEAKASIFGEHEVGDLRVRFLCTKNCDATVVAVQCHKELVETETFVPYRLVPRAPCVGEIQERLKIVEAGERSLRDLREGSCCAGGVATCCCCPCNTVACFTSQEVVTEEIFFITDSMEVKERPFHKAVSRSPWRLWNWRLFGWALSYLALHMMLSPFTTASTLAGLSRWGSLAPLLLLSMITLAVWATVVTAAYACYRPSMGIKYFVAVGIIIALPFLANQFLPGSRLQCRFCFLKHQYPGQGQVRMGRMRAGRRRCLGATLLGLAVGVAWEQGFVAPKVSTNPTQRHDALLWNVAGVSSWLGIPAQAQALQPPAACPAFKTGYARRQFEGVVIYR